MEKARRVLRGVAGVVAGLLASGFILMGGRQLAFGDGLAPSPVDLAAGAQAVVVITWATAAAAASWIASAISRGRLPSLIISAWLFQMIWLSPGVRPAEISIRAICSVVVALAGFAALVVHQSRHQSRPDVAAHAVR
jgi:hypothetical protein